MERLIIRGALGSIAALALCACADDATHADLIPPSTDVAAMTAAPLPAASDWSFLSSQAGAQAGAAVSGAGDVNGDGYADVLIAAPGWDGPEVDEGVVWLFDGASTGPGPVASWSWEPDQADAGLGDEQGAVGVGDVDGDGYDDVLLSAPGWGDGQAGEGGAWLFLGSAAGLGAAPAWTFEADQADAALHALGPAGDVDGDGLADLLLGAPTWDGSAGVDTGAVFLFLGTTGGPGAIADWTFEGTQVGAELGSRGGGAGDLDGDGFADLVVTAPMWDDSQTDAGAAFVFFGDPSGPGTTPDWATYGDLQDGMLGSAAAMVGDLDGDGYAELAVAAEEDDTGRVWIWAGGPAGPGPAAAWSLIPPAGHSLFGADLSSAGDTSGDGYADLLVGTGGGTGSALLYLGRSTGPAAEPDHTLLGAAGAGAFGASVAAAGDVDGDGFSDVIVGDEEHDGALAGEGGAFLFNGGQAPPGAGSAWWIAGGEAADYLGSEGMAAADFDGDGFDDLLVPDPYNDTLAGADAGMARIYYGDAAGLGAVGWFFEGTQLGARFGSALAAGDLDGDGYAEAVIGEGSWDGSTAPNEGRVLVFAGSPAGVSPSPSWSFEGGQQSARLGWSADLAVGDWNGDGIGDLAAGAFGWDGVLSNSGIVHVWFGSAGGLPSAPDWSVEGGSANGAFGSAVDDAGDIDRDGYSDLIVGAYSWSDVLNGQGAAFLHYGGPSGPAVSAGWSDTGDLTMAWYGSQVRGAGDIDGDGYPDIAVGAIGASSYDVTGRIHVLYGGPFGPDPFTELVLVGAPPSSSYDSQLGQAVDGRGDIDGDGYADLVGGDRDVPTQPGGQSYAWAGSPAGLGTVAVWAPGSAVSNLNWGTAVSYAGDVNADGFSDIVAGDTSYGGVYYYEEGRIHQFNGGAGFTGEPGAFPWRPRALQAGAGAPIPRGGLSVTAGFDLLMFARAPWGRARVKIQVEVEEHGTPFDGVDLVESAVWTDTGTAGLELVLPVTGLTGGLPHHWRARLAFDPSQAPPVRWTRWMYGEPGSPGGIHLRTWPDTDGDGDPDSTDCDVNDPTIYTGAPEVCDGQDQDCDGDVDEEFDGDGDGAFDGSDPGCAAAWAAADLVDCDDADPDIAPGATESCDAVDSDCDGSLVDGFDDGDGDGVPDCTDLDDDGDGYEAEADGGDDCDDADPDINPGVAEVCDDLDADCDGSLVDEFADLDGDGLPDCVDVDADGDGAAAEAAGGADCDDSNPNVHPGAGEPCDGLDSNCDGLIPDLELDGDEDGYLACGDPPDCDDDEPTVHAGAPELCDGLDNDCDGAIESPEAQPELPWTEYFADFDDDGWGNADAPHEGNPLCDEADGFVEQVGDCNDGDATIHPEANEIPENDVDEDCDGEADRSASTDDDDDEIPAPGVSCGCEATGGRPAPARLLLTLPWLARRRRYGAAISNTPQPDAA